MNQLLSKGLWLRTGNIGLFPCTIRPSLLFRYSQWQTISGKVEEMESIHPRNVLNLANHQNDLKIHEVKKKLEQLGG